MNKVLSKALYLNWSFSELVIAFPGEESDWLYNYACYYAKLGQKNLALHYLTQDLQANPYLDSDPRKDRDLQKLWNDKEFITLIDSNINNPFKLTSFATTRLILFDIAGLFIIFSALIFALNRQMGSLIFEYGILIGFVIEFIQAMIFRQRVFFLSMTRPLTYGVVFFSFFNMVAYNAGIWFVSPVVYGVAVILNFVEMPYQWFVFGPRLKEYTSYRIQNIASGTLTATALIFTVLQAGKLIQQLSTQECAPCIDY
jgi:hypothetical protein